MATNSGIFVSVDDDFKAIDAYIGAERAEKQAIKSNIENISSSIKALAPRIKRILQLAEKIYSADRDLWCKCCEVSFSKECAFESRVGVLGVILETWSDGHNSGHSMRLGIHKTRSDYDITRVDSDVFSVGADGFSHFKEPTRGEKIPKSMEQAMWFASEGFAVYEKLFFQWFNATFKTKSAEAPKEPCSVVFKRLFYKTNTSYGNVVAQLRGLGYSDAEIFKASEQILKNVVLD